MSVRAFADTNVVLYLMSQDAQKAERARTVIAERPIISVQVLNEITNVARRKLTLPWNEIDEFLQLVRGLCPVESLTLQTHDRRAQSISPSVGAKPLFTALTCRRWMHSLAPMPNRRDR